MSPRRIDSGLSCQQFIPRISPWGLSGRRNLLPSVDSGVPFVPFVPAGLEAQLPRNATGSSIAFSPRALVLLTLITLWMFRLSYNTFRRGLFSLKDEDYRWAVLRKQFDERRREDQCVVGWPAYLAVTRSGAGGIELVDTDYVLAVWVLGILAVEFTADKQQFVYQTYKSKKPTSRKLTLTLFALLLPWLGLRTLAEVSSLLVSEDTPVIPISRASRRFWWLICAVPVFAELVSSGRLGTINETVTGTPDNQVLSWDGIISAISGFVEWIFDVIGISSTSAAQDSSHFSFASFPANELTHFFPAIALSIPFVSSTAYTEAISSSTYPIWTSQEFIGVFVNERGVVETYNWGRDEEEGEGVGLGESESVATKDENRNQNRSACKYRALCKATVCCITANQSLQGNIDILNIPSNDDVEEEEFGDSLSSLPGSGLGPPTMQVYDPYRYIAQTSSYISDYKGLQSTEEKKDPNPVFAPILAKNFFVQAVQIALPSQEYVLIKEWMVWISVPENCTCWRTKNL
ncbi:hypothetical protein GGU10DRAFT_417427 [Lentinula aff. detonsa]|uniref:Uncharacterized protein n=1 Tax=Lentinula aff. detonsa TaxID=2804958 RepID=A0AA38KL15_9AGAR|nr:hypothetical protein GGU10DRAFT_417427 [Lentinula aff. detonsa]